jgi:phosphonopyruvate decarboxylase
MIKVSSLINLLKKNNSNFFTGVPDSVLKELSISLQNKDKKQHIIAANEGSAVALGIGYYLSTRKIPCIYMQNSGLSNALNPLISIAHKRVYSIPLILIIGWRGSPKIKDEPQHNVKGEITKSILKLLNIKYTILRSNNDLKKFDKQIKIAKKKSSIVACLIEQGTLEKIKKVDEKKDFYNLDK